MVTPDAGHPVGPLSGWRPRPESDWWPSSLLPLLAAGADNLLLSEYVEGSSNNKAIEIFNGTGATVDLAAGGYQLEVYFNGSATAVRAHRVDRLRRRR